MIRVVDEWKTLGKLKQGYSICRFGDGELRLCLKEPLHFQKYDKDLRKKLRSALKSSRENLLVAIPRIYDGTEHLNPDWVYVPGWRAIASQSIKLLSSHKTYYSAFITRPEAVKGLLTKEYFLKIKEIWENKNVLYVGNARKIKQPGWKMDFFTEKEIIEHELFENTASVTYKSAPKENAYSNYEELCKECLSSNKLVLLSLGPTATALAYELAEKQIIDIGQLLTIHRLFKDDSQPKHVSDEEWARRNPAPEDLKSYFRL